MITMTLFSILGSAVTLSLDGSILVSGGAYDNDSVGAIWIFVYDGPTYRQVDKLVGTDPSGASRQGKGGVTIFFCKDQESTSSPYMSFDAGYAVSCSSNGRIIAVGGPGDNNGIGATWIFSYNGSTYKQLGKKLVGTGSSGSSQQGNECIQ